MADITYTIDRQDLLTNDEVEVISGLTSKQYLDSSSDLVEGRYYKYKISSVVGSEKLRNESDHVVILYGDRQLELVSNKNVKYLELSLHENIVKHGQETTNDDILNNKIRCIIVGHRSQLEANSVELISNTSGIKYDDLLLCPSAMLSADLFDDVTKVYINNWYDSDMVTIGSLALIGNEVVRVKRIDNQKKYLIIDRGVIDSAPKYHITGTPVIFYGSNNTQEEVITTTLNNKIDHSYRQSRSDKLYHSKDIETNKYYIKSRINRPLAPVDVKINDIYKPSGSSGLLYVEWKHRDQLSATDEPTDWFSSSGSLTQGVEYRVDIYSGENTLIRSVSAGQKTYASIDVSDFEYNHGYIKVVAIKDNIESIDSYSAHMKLNFDAPKNVEALKLQSNNMYQVKLTWDYDEITDEQVYFDDDNGAFNLSWAHDSNDDPINKKDPNWGDVVVLIDANTTYRNIVERSIKNQSFTTSNASTKLLTSPLFGYYNAITFDQTSTAGSIKTTTNGVLYTDDFTMEIIVRPSSIDATNGTRLFSVGDYTGSAEGGGIQLVALGNTLQLYVYKDGIEGAIVSTGFLNINTDSHVVLMRKDRRFYVFINGEKVATGKPEFDYYSIWKTDLYIGSDSYYNYPLYGDIAAFRLTKNIARYPIEGFNVKKQRLDSPVEVWDPSQIKDQMKLWISSDSVIADTSNRISQLTDKSGNGLHYTQATNANKPILVKNAYNNNPAIRFDGVNDVLYSSNASKSLFRNTSKFTIFAVIKQPDTPKATENMLFQNSVNASSSNRASIVTMNNRIYLGSRSNDSNWLSLYVDEYDYSNIEMIQYDVDFSSSITCYYNGDFNKIRTDMVGTSIPDTESKNVSSIGGNELNSATYAFAGDLLELIVIVDNVLNEEDRKKLEGWATHKYGIVRQLPSNHKYKQNVPQKEERWTPNLINPSLFYTSLDAVISNNGVSRLNDQSGNGINATGVSTPLLRLINKVPTINFNGTSQYFNIGNAAKSILAGADSWWMFTVSNSSTSTTDNDIFVIGATCKITQLLNTNTITIGGRRVDNDTWSSISSTSNINGSSIITFGQADYNNRSLLLYLNGILEAANYSWLTQGVAAATTGPCRIGAQAYDPPSVFAAARISCAILGRGVLSESDRQRLEGWAAHEYNITSSLKNGHPYKEKRPLLEGELYVKPSFIEYAQTSLPGYYELDDKGTIPKLFNNSAKPSVHGFVFGGSDSLYTKVPSLDFAFGTGDFTIEACFILNSATDGGTLMDLRNIHNPTGGLSYAYVIHCTPSGVSISDGVTITSMNMDFELGVKYSIAYSRVNGIIYGFINGVKLDERVSTIDHSNPRVCYIGCSRSDTDTWEFPFTGIISNIRITKGIGKYSANYLLTYQNKTYWSPTMIAPDIIVSGENVVHASNSISQLNNIALKEIPLTQSVAASQPKLVFDTELNKNVIVFDGVDDYLIAPNLSKYMYAKKSALYSFFVVARSDDDSNNVDRGLISVSGGVSTKFRHLIKANSTESNSFSFETSKDDETSTNSFLSDIKSSKKYQMILCMTDYKKGIKKVYVDGKLIVNESVDTGIMSGVSIANLTIGAINTGTVTGFSNIKLAECIVGTTPLSDDDIENLFGYASKKYGLTYSLHSDSKYKIEEPIIDTTYVDKDPYIANVVSLIHFDKFPIVDTKGSYWNVTGGVDITTDRKRFGNSSVKFNGTNGYISGSAATMTLGTDDFTIEFWINMAAYRTTTDESFIGYGASTSNGFVIMCPRNNGDLGIWDGAGYYSTNGTSLALDVWNHVALCRQNNNLYYYLNGEKYLLVENYTRAINANSDVRIGANYANTSDNYSNFYMDEYRVTKGICRYTDNFEVSKTRFPDI